MPFIIKWSNPVLQRVVTKLTRRIITTPGSGSHVLQVNNGTYSFVTSASLDQHIGKNNLTLTAPRSLTLGASQLTFIGATGANLVEFKDGNVEVSEGNLVVNTAVNGLQQKSPDGTDWLMTVNNAGIPTWTSQ